MRFSVSPRALATIGSTALNGDPVSSAIGSFVPSRVTGTMMDPFSVKSIVAMRPSLQLSAKAGDARKIDVKAQAISVRRGSGVMAPALRFRYARAQLSHE